MGTSQGNDFTGGSHVDSPTIELTRIQKKKLQYLLDKGASVTASLLYFQMGKGFGTLDPFGQVKWADDLNSQLQETKDE